MQLALNETLDNIVYACENNIKVFVWVIHAKYQNHSTTLATYLFKLMDDKSKKYTKLQIQWNHINMGTGNIQT